MRDNAIAQPGAFLPGMPPGAAAAVWFHGAYVRRLINTDAAASATPAPSPAMAQGESTGTGVGDGASAAADPE